MILDCQNICKSFGTDVILNNISFHLEEKEKMAIVGINGAGKTTLLKIIMGEEEADSGQVIISKDRTIGYLSQYQESNYNTIQPNLGSSPRVWGQGRFYSCWVCIGGIIPTRVGTSLSVKASSQISKDHPHACGDKYAQYSIASLKAGSSPRVWGQACPHF